MLGRYVPQLEFLAVLLGDEPALDLKDSFFQRLLARDQDEAEDLIIERLKTEPADSIFDSMLVPALCAARGSAPRGEITEADQRAIMRSLSEIVEDLGDIRSCAAAIRRRCQHKTRPMPQRIGRRRSSSSAALPAMPPTPSRFKCSKKLLDPARWQIRLIAPETLTAELLELIARNSRPLVCIASLAPGGLAHTRYRLQAALRAVPRPADHRRPLGRGSARRSQTPPGPGRRRRLEHRVLVDRDATEARRALPSA